MDSDVFEDDADNDQAGSSRNEEITFASREINRNLNSIETAAFHEAFDLSREKSAQRAFETGYRSISHHFGAISMLEGIFDSIRFSLPKAEKASRSDLDSNQSEITDLDDIKRQFTTLYDDIFAQSSAQADLGNASINVTYSSLGITLPADLIARFNRLKVIVVELCERLELCELCRFVNANICL